MHFKTDTKEKFHVIRIEETSLSASMAEELGEMLLSYIQNDGNKPANVVLDFAAVQQTELPVAEKIAGIQQNFYEHNCSFVVCNLQEQVMNAFEQAELSDILNITPTESEAWDIIQMEEIERELMGGGEG